MLTVSVGIKACIKIFEGRVIANTEILQILRRVLFEFILRNSVSTSGGLGFTIKHYIAVV
jgi:hypothetical protein